MRKLWKNLSLPRILSPWGDQGGKTLLDKAVCSLRRIRAVARKEIRQLLRDRFTLGWVVGVPAVQLMLFGYAINQDVRHVATAVFDPTESHVTRRLVGQLEATQTFKVTRRATSEAEARRLLEKGEVRTAIVVPPDFTRAYYRGRGAEILVLVDATDPILARAAKAATNGLAERYQSRLERFQVDDSPGALRAPRQLSSFLPQPELVHERFLSLAALNLFNPELRTAVFVVPALLGVILTTTMILMTSLALVRERERGSFEFLIATPVGRAELMAGKIVPFIAIGFIQIAIVLVCGLLLFRVPVVGGVFDLGLAAFAFIAANLTLGLVISSITESQFQATQLSFFFFLPSVLLSGFMFPFESMPRPAQWLGEMLPLTHFIRATRGILLRGSSITDHVDEMAAMLLFCLVFFLAATRLFRKQLD